MSLVSQCFPDRRDVFRGRTRVDSIPIPDVDHQRCERDERADQHEMVFRDSGHPLRVSGDGSNRRALRKITAQMISVSP